NAYGTQIDSFAASLDTPDTLAGLHGVFIRAPRILRVGPRVEVLARHAGDPVLVREGAVWAATFHPELGDDDRVLRLWLGAAPAARPACGRLGRRAQPAGDGEQRAGDARVSVP